MALYGYHRVKAGGAIWASRGDRPYEANRRQPWRAFTDAAIERTMWHPLVSLGCLQVLDPAALLIDQPRKGEMAPRAGPAIQREKLNEIKGTRAPMGRPLYHRLVSPVEALVIRAGAQPNCLF